MSLSFSVFLSSSTLGFADYRLSSSNFTLRNGKQGSLLSRHLNFGGRLSHEAYKRKREFVVMSKSVLTADKTVEETSKEKSYYDAIVIGSGIGGLVAATQLAVKGARVLVLEKYVIPGGSSGYYQRHGYTFDVGSSVMFGFSDKVSVLFDQLNSFCLFSMSLIVWQ